MRSIGILLVLLGCSEGSEAPELTELQNVQATMAGPTAPPAPPLPEIVAPPTLEVRVAFPGSSPIEVEATLVRPLEAAMRGLTFVSSLTSTALAGEAIVTVHTHQGTDAAEARQRLADAVAGISSLPADAAEPTVSIVPAAGRGAGP